MRKQSYCAQVPILGKFQRLSNVSVTFKIGMMQEYSEVMMCISASDVHYYSI
jgi:hypothetical protein